MKLTVLHNADAGDGSWTRSRVQQLLSGLGHDVQLVKSAKGWRKKLDADADAYVAVGGDGTVHKLMRAVLDRGRPVAILPAGTANNVAHALGYTAGDDLEQRVARWSKRQRVLSIAQVEADNGKTRLCIEATGAGAFVDMRQNRDPNAVRSAPGEVLAAVRRALIRSVLRVEPVPIRAEIDGHTCEDDFVLFECLNLNYFGPRVRLFRHEETHRAPLVVIGVRPEQREALAALINDGERDAEPFVLARGKRITLSMAAGTHVDGKLWPKRGSESLTIRGGAGKLRVWV